MQRRIVLSLGSFAMMIAGAQDIKLGVTFVCGGERMFVENCNIRDTSDTSTCMVGHPDTVNPNGIMKYTYETRGALKKLFPTCTQPSAKEVAAVEAHQKKQQEIYDANVRKANPPAPPPVTANQVRTQLKPKTPEERAMARCISAGRLPATCTGNSLLGAFSDMISKVLPDAGPNGGKARPAGPEMAGVFQGAGAWRLDFIDDGVLVNCSFLAPDQHSYTVAFRNNLAILTIDTKPRPLVLNVKADGIIVGPGPLEIDGVIPSGGGGGGPDYQFRDSNGMRISNAQAASSAGPIYDNSGNHVSNSAAAQAAQASSGGGFISRRATCPALNLSSKGASVGIQTMQTDLLKTMFGGEKGPPTPPGIRMRGIFAASTGFSTQFYPESVVLGCGPDAARAYPYTVVADGTKMQIKVDAPDHPLMLGFRPDGSLDAGAGSYQVHGRTVTGQNNDGDFTFAPFEQSCGLGVLAPSKTIPASGGDTVTAAGTLISTAAAPLGNAILTINSGFPAPPNAPNQLAGHPFTLLRDSYANVVAKGGVTVPAGMTAYKYIGVACGPNRSPDCQKIQDAVKAASVSSARANLMGTASLPGVPAGTYYLMISTRYNNQIIVWGQAVELKPGNNAMKLDASNATPVN